MVSPFDLHIKRLEEGTFQGLEQVRTELKNFEARHLPNYTEPLPTQIVLRDEQHTIYGSMFCTFKWNALFIADLWVAEPHRRQGLGRRLLADAEDLAITHNCQFILVETSTLYHHTIYEKSGFKEILKIDNYPEGYIFFIFKKDLN